MSEGGEPHLWRYRGGELRVDRPLVMGILNLTPDSFSDGGELPDLGAAMRRAERLVEEGADLLDVGGESTRPGATELPVEEEIGRILRFVEEASASLEVPVSVDTRRAGVAEAALDAGAVIVNDVSGLAHDAAMARVVGDAGVGLVLMHMRGSPSTMGERATYGDVVAEVGEELGAALARADEAGIPRDRIVIDPGIGFAKAPRHNLTILRNLGELSRFGRPILVGPSRKSFIGAITGLPPQERVEGTVAACVLAYAAGARIFRVHDVKEVRRALEVARAIQEECIVERGC